MAARHSWHQLRVDDMDESGDVHHALLHEIQTRFLGCPLCGEMNHLPEDCTLHESKAETLPALATPLSRASSASGSFSPTPGAPASPAAPGSPTPTPSHSHSHSHSHAAPPGSPGATPRSGGSGTPRSHRSSRRRRAGSSTPTSVDGDDWNSTDKSKVPVRVRWSECVCVCACVREYVVGCVVGCCGVRCGLLRGAHVGNGRRVVLAKMCLLFFCFFFTSGWRGCAGGCDDRQDATARLDPKARLFLQEAKADIRSVMKAVTQFKRLVARRRAERAAAGATGGGVGPTASPATAASGSGSGSGSGAVVGGGRLAQQPLSHRAVHNAAAAAAVAKTRKGGGGGGGGGSGEAKRQGQQVRGGNPRAPSDVRITPISFRSDEMYVALWQHVQGAGACVMWVKRKVCSGTHCSVVISNDEKGGGGAPRYVRQALTTCAVHCDGCAGIVGT